MSVKHGKLCYDIAIEEFREKILSLCNKFFLKKEQPKVKIFLSFTFKYLNELSFCATLCLFLKKKKKKKKNCQI